jgi:hypothetical protein
MLNVILQRIRAIGSILAGIHASHEAIEREQSEIALLLQATGCEEAFSLGILARLDAAERALNDLAADRAGLGERIKEAEWLVGCGQGGLIPAGRGDGEGPTCADVRADFNAEAAEACLDHPRDHWGGLLPRTNLDQALEPLGGVREE